MNGLIPVPIAAEDLEAAVCALLENGITPEQVVRMVEAACEGWDGDQP